MGKADRQAIFLKALRESGGLVRVAAEVCGIPAETYHAWRHREESFRLRADRVKEEARIEKKSREGTRHVYDPKRVTRKVPGLEEFRWDYLGRPTLPHQVPVVRAWEDRTNRVVKVLGPPGSGKRHDCGGYFVVGVGSGSAACRLDHGILRVLDPPLGPHDTVFD